MYRDFGTVFFAVIMGIVMVTIPLIISWLIAPSNKTKDKLDTYECGEEAEGSAWLQFNIRFYIIALIFLIFANRLLPDFSKTFAFLFFYNVFELKSAPGPIKPIYL